jgi:hypothetical protein
VEKGLTGNGVDRPLTCFDKDGCIGQADALPVLAERPGMPEDHDAKGEFRQEDERGHKPRPHPGGRQANQAARKDQGSRQGQGDPVVEGNVRRNDGIQPDPFIILAGGEPAYVTVPCLGTLQLAAGCDQIVVH